MLSPVRGIPSRFSSAFSIRRARTREADLAIAACAIRQQAKLWTLNIADFADIPQLQLFEP